MKQFDSPAQAFNRDLNGAGPATKPSSSGKEKQPSQQTTTALVPDATPVIVRLSDVTPEPIKPLWPGRFYVGKVSMIAGDPGLGKSMLTVDLAARVSNGCGWPDLPGETYEPGGVVMLSAEDDLADTIVPRLNAAGADVSRIVALTAVNRRPKFNPDRESPPEPERCWIDLKRDLKAIEEAIATVENCRLVIIDPISAYLGSTDSHVNSDVRSALAPLGDLAQRRQVALVAVTHLRKSGEGSAIHKVIGSLAFVAAARTAWGVTRDKGDPTGKRRLMINVKNNLGAETHGLAFELMPSGLGKYPCIAWDTTPVVIGADDAMSPDNGRPGPDADERESAMAWLADALSRGPRLVKDVEDEAINGEGISRATLKRAKQALDVESFRETVPGAWWWQLPDSTSSASPHFENLEHLEPLAKSGHKQGFSGSDDEQDSKGFRFSEYEHVGEGADS